MTCLHQTSNLDYWVRIQKNQNRRAECRCTLLFSRNVSGRALFFRDFLSSSWLWLPRMSHERFRNTETLFFGCRAPGARTQLGFRRCKSDLFARAKLGRTRELGGGV